MSAGEDYITSEQLIREFQRVKRAIDISASHHRWSFNHLTFGYNPTEPYSDSRSPARPLEGISNKDTKANGVNGHSFDHLNHASDDEDKPSTHSEGILISSLFDLSLNFCFYVVVQPLRQMC